MERLGAVRFDLNTKLLDHFTIGRIGQRFDENDLVAGDDADPYSRLETHEAGCLPRARVSLWV